MEKYKVKLNRRVFRDIDSIFEYIALEKQSPENAKGQTDRIWEALKSLDTFPQSHQERTEGRYAGKGYRQLIIDNYIAIFRIDDDNMTVYIVTVQYQGRNL
jgi:toxin ParE1/3/4